MRWNCPHCGTSLAIRDDKLEEGWSFSRCYQCGGFALVKKNSSNLVKMDRAPQGEPVILPESSIEPRVSQKTAQTLRQTAIQPPPFKAIPAPANTGTQAAAISFPPPLPELTNFTMDHTRRPRVMRAPRRMTLNPVAIAIGLSGVLAAVSGVYLYTQGRALWKKATEVSQRPALMREEPAHRTNEFVTQLRHEDVARTIAKTTETNDRITQSAMAPSRAPAIHQETPPTVPKQVTHSSLRVRALNASAKLRTGPGKEYPILALGNPDTTYLIKDWKGPWFMVVSEEPDHKVAWILNDDVEPAYLQAGESR